MKTIVLQPAELQSLDVGAFRRFRRPVEPALASTERLFWWKDRWVRRDVGSYTGEPLVWDRTVEHPLGRRDDLLFVVEERDVRFVLRVLDAGVVQDQDGWHWELYVAVEDAASTNISEETSP